jgi:SAM-dependent methyltransferase
VERPLVNYRHSPHLAQWALADRLAGILHATIRELSDAGLPLRVLEVGAGHGGFAGHALAAGCEVTAAEMSAPAFEDLETRYGTNDRLTAVADPGATLSGVGEGFALAVCVSVLHHIPDYLDLLQRITARLLPGGALLTLQDPLWYPRVGRVTRAVDRTAYLTWRIGQGNVGPGLAAMRRRLRGAYPEAKDGEIVYHHVVRQGVDERAVAASLAGRFSDVEVFPYWSNHLGAVHRVAEAAGLANTFGVRATGYDGGSSV